MPNPPRSADSRETCDAGSSKSPKNRACAGHASTHAGCRSVSGSEASWMRSTHSVHFFIVPDAGSSSRAPYGHAQAHRLQPMHLSWSTRTIPSLRLYDAPVGHTVTHSASSQCMQDIGTFTV